MKLSDSRLMLIYWLFTGTGKSYDSMVNVATFGINRLWKRRMVNLMPPESGRILDLASGTGISTLAIAHRYSSNCHIVGVELRKEYLDIARRKGWKFGLKNIKWVLGRAEDYYSEEPFDCISPQKFTRWKPRLFRRGGSASSRY